MASVEVKSDSTCVKHSIDCYDDMMNKPSISHPLGVYHQIGQLDQAEIYIKDKALPIYEKHLGKHPYTATAWNSLGVVYQKMGRFSSAKEYLMKGLKLREELLGDHGDTMRSLHALGSFTVECARRMKTADRMSSLQDAKNYFKKAGEIGLRAIGHMEDTAGSFKEVADICRTLGETEEAERYDKKVCEIMRKFDEVRKGIVSKTIV